MRLNKYVSMDYARYDKEQPIFKYVSMDYKYTMNNNQPWSIYQRITHCTINNSYN